jgi:diguanylate cyclase (GGDEF)-like protein/PAS domain S-box-containing protein
VTPSDKAGGRVAARIGFAVGQATATGFALLDASGHVLLANDSYARLTGRTATGLEGVCHGDLVHPDDRARVQRALAHVLERESFTSVDARYTANDGTATDVRIVATSIRSDDAGEVLVQVLPTAGLPGSDEVFRQVFALAPIPQATISPDATFMHVNRVGCELVGYEEHALVGQPFATVVHPDSMVEATDAFLSLVSGQERETKRELRLLTRTGETVEAEVFGSAVVDDAGQPLYLVVLVQDISERRQREQQMWHLAVHDALTELPNRAWFLERLGQAVARGRRERSRLAVFFLDLDGFKAVNDTLGHDAGDQVLFTAAGRMSRVLRPGDTLARYGGDEFTVLCEDIPGAAGVSEIAERILAALRTPFRVASGEAMVTASIGVALADAGTHPAPTLLQAADHAMYAAKAAGGGAYQITTI